MSTPWCDPLLAASATGIKSFITAADAAIDREAGKAALEVTAGNGAGAAYMQFHRPGVFATHFGFDQSNELCIGGWSLGSNKYRILHEGNIGTNVNLESRVNAIVAAKQGERSLHVRDIPNFDPTGATDHSDALQDLVDLSVARGVPVYGDNCVIKLTKPINLPSGFTFIGSKAGPTNIWENENSIPANQIDRDDRGTTFLLAHTGKGFIQNPPAGNPNGNRYQGGVTLSRMGTLRPQNAPGAGWTPIDADYDFYFDKTADLIMDRIHMHRSTNGIYANGERIDLDRITGQIFKDFIKIDWSYDVVKISNVHCWPYWSVNANVFQYTWNNLRVVQLGRVDNPRLYSIFGFNAFRLLSLNHFVGTGIDGDYPDGSTSKLSAFGLDADGCQQGLYVAPSVGALGANGPSATGQIYGFTTQGPNVPTAVPPIDIQGSRCTLKIWGHQSTQSGASVVHVGGTNNRLFIDTETGNYDLNGSGTAAAIVTNSATNIVFISPESRISDGRPTGQLAPIFSGPPTSCTGLDLIFNTAVGWAGGNAGTNCPVVINYNLSADGWVNFTMRGQIITKGTGLATVNLPFATKHDALFVGRETNVTGQMLAGQAIANGSSIAFTDDDNNHPFHTDGMAFILSGSFRSTFAK